MANYGMKLDFDTAERQQDPRHDSEGYDIQNNQVKPFPQAGTVEIENGFPARVKVLVTDDEMVIADTLAIILNRSGFEARAVYSGRAAIAAVSSFALDILISDVMMPEMTGIEAAIAILAQHPNCKVLLFSGQAATANLLNEAKTRGHCFEILTKPIHPTDLLAKLRTGDFLVKSAA